ncbi:MAG: hypothetical protein IT288_08645 [Bdellovibrionales bacterium]|nr:hypothetical protein [Bdellovibrionales bacterium]
MPKNSAALVGLLLSSWLIFGTAVAAEGPGPSPEEFFFPGDKLEFFGSAFTLDGKVLNVAEPADPRFESPRCGLTTYKTDPGISEWMFALYEVRRQSMHNVRLAALPSMVSRGILSNATEERETGFFEYQDKRAEPMRPVRLSYGPIKAEYSEDEAKKFGGSIPRAKLFSNADYFVTFKLPHLENSSGMRDAAVVIYFFQGKIQGFEYRFIVRKAATHVDASKVPGVMRELPAVEAGEEKYYSYIVCK